LEVPIIGASQHLEVGAGILAILRVRSESGQSLLLALRPPGPDSQREVPLLLAGNPTISGANKIKVG
jgi:Flp pilus assembly protein CpaB